MSSIYSRFDNQLYVWLDNPTRRKVMTNMKPSKGWPYWGALILFALPVVVNIPPWAIMVTSLYILSFALFYFFRETIPTLRNQKQSTSPAWLNKPASIALVVLLLGVAGQCIYHFYFPPV